jgi:hypothetical protein
MGACRGRAAAVALGGLLALLFAAPAVAGKHAYSGALYYFSAPHEHDEGTSVKLNMRRHEISGFSYHDPRYQCINDAFDPTDDTYESASFRLASFHFKGRSFKQRFEERSGDEFIRVDLTGRVMNGSRKLKGTIDQTSSDMCGKNWVWKAKLKR